MGLRGLRPERLRHRRESRRAPIDRPGPRLELRDGLVHEHPATRHDASAARPRVAQQARAARAHRRRRAPPPPDGCPSPGPANRRCSVRPTWCSTSTSCGMLASDSSGPAPCAPSSRASDSRSLDAPVQHAHRGTALDQSEDDRARGAASTEHDGARTGAASTPARAREPRRSNRCWRRPADPPSRSTVLAAPIRARGRVHLVDELQDRSSCAGSKPRAGGSRAPRTPAIASRRARPGRRTRGRQRRALAPHTRRCASPESACARRDAARCRTERSLRSRARIVLSTRGGRKPIGLRSRAPTMLRVVRREDRWPSRARAWRSSWAAPSDWEVMKAAERDARRARHRERRAGDLGASHSGAPHALPRQPPKQDGIEV